MEDERNNNNNKPETAAFAPKIDSVDHNPLKHSAAANEEVLTDPKEGTKPFASPVVPAYLGGEASKGTLDDTQVFLIELYICMTRKKRSSFPIS